jgi:arsenite-transporting ATPase
MNSIPGVDEATSFGAVLRQINDFNFSTVVFDTAPTGHTLRLLNFPTILEKVLKKMIGLKEKLGGLVQSVNYIFNPQASHRRF